MTNTCEYVIRQLEMHSSRINKEQIIEIKVLDLD